MPVSEYWAIAGSVIAPNIGGIVNAYITRKNIHTWYETLKKPSWTPPNWAFGPVWTTIYSSAGYASYLVIRDSPTLQELALPMSMYGLNLALNWAWPSIFFSFHKIKWAFYDIVLLWGSTAAMGVLFYRVNTTAGILIAPYLAWGTYAAAINYYIWKYNPTEGETSGTKEKVK